MIQWIVFPWEHPSEGVRVSSGHLREAEAPTESAAENSPSAKQKHRPRRLTYGVGAGLCARP